MVHSTLNNYTDVIYDLFVSYEHTNLSGRSLSPVPRVPQLPRCSADPPMWRNAPELAVFLLFVTLGLMWWRDLVDRCGAFPRSQHATHLVTYKFKLIKLLHLNFKFKLPNLQIWWRWSNVSSTRMIYSYSLLNCVVMYEKRDARFDILQYAAVSIQPGRYFLKLCFF